MPDSEVRHSESWSPTIKPADGESWPDSPYPYGRGVVIRPISIRVGLTRGARGPSVTVTGLKLKQNGTPGMRDARFQLFDTPGYDWVAEVVEHERTKHKLGPAPPSADGSGIGRAAALLTEVEHRQGQGAGHGNQGIHHLRDQRG